MLTDSNSSRLEYVLSRLFLLRAARRPTSRTPGYQHLQERQLERCINTCQCHARYAYAVYIPTFVFLDSNPRLFCMYG